MNRYERRMARQKAKPAPAAAPPRPPVLSDRFLRHIELTKAKPDPEPNPVRVLASLLPGDRVDRESVDRAATLADAMTTLYPHDATVPPSRPPTSLPVPDTSPLPLALTVLASSEPLGAANAPPAPLPLTTGHTGRREAANEGAKPSGERSWMRVS